ncbi:MAG: TRAP transporter fused permease subunit [Thermodesulfobacteriota bacterium]
MADDRQLSAFWRWTVISFSIISVLVAVNQIFDLKFFSNVILFEPSFHFLITGFLIPIVFLAKPLRPGRGFFWLDVIFFLVYWLGSLYLAWYGYDILTKGYGYSAPLDMTIISIIIWLLLMEALRRSAGMVLTVIVLFFALYPTFASHMPGLLEGVQRSFDKTAVFHILSVESAMGELLKVFAGFLFGYIIFGEAVIATGGSDFLLNLADSFVGKTRGGPAKIAVIGSALFGSVSGSPMANVITTGSITIPAMKSTGYSPEYAGAIETCASTAGTFTPPIMGATAFVLASFINMPYSQVALGAAIPAFLFYLGLFIQVDGYAARNNLRGQIRQNVPRIREVLRDGWFYLPTLLALLYFLFVLRWTGESAYIATAVMLILAQCRKKTRFSGESFMKFLQSSVKSSAVLLAIMIGAGFLMGSFSLTGIASTFSRELFMLAGGSVPLMLFFTAVASLIMGMGMTMIACYIFLALVVAPALVTAGLNEFAVHMFVLYCGMLSYITPPVALCAFTAAGIAKASPMRIGIMACRLGGAIFILPFFFVIEPALLMQGDWWQIVYTFITAALGICLLGSALEGYLMGIGNLRTWPYGILFRGALLLAGALLALPGWMTDAVGMAGTIVIFALLVMTRQPAAETDK